MSTFLQRPLALMLKAMIRGYQIVVSPLLGPRCRFYPSCSDYALEAVTRHGVAAGGWLSLKRLAHCHPWGGSGIDAVPDAPLTRANAPHSSSSTCCSSPSHSHSL